MPACLRYLRGRQATEGRCHRDRHNQWVCQPPRHSHWRIASQIKLYNSVNGYIFQTCVCGPRIGYVTCMTLVAGHPGPDQGSPEA